MPVLVAHVYDTSKIFHDQSGGPLKDSLDKFPYLMRDIARAGPPAQLHQHFLVQVGKAGPATVCQQGPFTYAEMTKEPRPREAFKCTMAVNEAPGDQVDMVAGLMYAAATLRSAPQVRSRGLIIYGNLASAGVPGPIPGLDLRGVCVGLVYGSTESRSGRQAVGAATRRRELHESWRAELIKAGAHEVRLFEPVLSHELWKWFAGNLWECLRLPPHMLRSTTNSALPRGER